MKTLDELTDEVWGVKGTPYRDEMETRLDNEIRASRIGKAIKNAREQQHMTQQALSEKVGIKCSQIKGIEKGAIELRLNVLSRIFQALGIPPATADFGVAGKLNLW